MIYLIMQVVFFIDKTSDERYLGTRLFCILLSDCGFDHFYSHYIELLQFLAAFFTCHHNTNYDIFHISSLFHRWLDSFEKYDIIVEDLFVLIFLFIDFNWFFLDIHDGSWQLSFKIYLFPRPQTIALSQQ